MVNVAVVTSCNPRHRQRKAGRSGEGKRRGGEGAFSRVARTSRPSARLFCGSNAWISWFRWTYVALISPFACQLKLNASRDAPRAPEGTGRRAARMFPNPDPDLRPPGSPLLPLSARDPEGARFGARSGLFSAHERPHAPRACRSTRQSFRTHFAVRRPSVLRQYPFRAAFAAACEKTSLASALFEPRDATRSDAAFECRYRFQIIETKISRLLPATDCRACE